MSRKESEMKKFTGIYPALITPFDENGGINMQAIEQIIESAITKGVSGFYVGGSTGESYLLSVEERKQVLETVVKVVGDRVRIIANIGMFATEHGISLARHAQQLGIAAISSVPPFYFKFNMDEYAAYYSEIADAVSVPMIIYNIPAMSGVHFGKQDIDRLFKKENIIGMKHTSYDLFQMQQVIEEHPEKSVFIGHDELLLSAYAAGARAAIGSTFNFMAEKFIVIENLFKQKKLEEALIIQGQVNSVVEVLVEIGVFKGIKAALKMQGIDCGVCRKPFTPLSEADEKRLAEVLEKTGCL